VINVAVTDFHETTMEIRILVSASNSGRAFDLRCEMREKRIDFIQREYPDALPRTRAALEDRRQVDGRKPSSGEKALDKMRS
jgi:hypothetical protein